MRTTQPDALVVGAGVIGLTTGVCLAEQGLRVQLWTRSAPSATTSAVASAMIGPGLAAGDDRAAEWERVSIGEFTGLADLDGAGVTLRRGRLASREPGPALPGLQPCAPHELPDGFAGGFWTTLPPVDMQVYLAYLVRRLHAAGATIEHREVASLGELAGQAELLVNCSGLGARDLVPDPSVRPVRGQHVIVDRPRSGRHGRPTGPTPTTSCSGAPRSTTTRTSNRTRSWPSRSGAAASRSSRGCAPRGFAVTRSGSARGDRPCGWRSTISTARGGCTTTATTAAA